MKGLLETDVSSGRRLILQALLHTGAVTAILAPYGLSLRDLAASDLGAALSKEHIVSGGVESEAVAIANATARRLLCAQARPSLEALPVVRRLDLSWGDVMSVLELVADPSELKRVTDEPAAFVTRIEGSPPSEWLTDLVAKRFGIVALRQEIEASYATLLWADVLPAIELIGDVDTLTRLARDPAAVLESLMKPPRGVESQWRSAVRAKLTLAKLRPKLAKVLAAREIDFELLVNGLASGALSEPELRAGLSSPQSIVELVVSKLKVKQRAKVRTYAVDGAKEVRAKSPSSTAGTTSVGVAAASGGGTAGLMGGMGITMPVEFEMPALDLEGFHIPDFAFLEEVQEGIKYVFDVLSSTKSRILIAMYQVTAPIPFVYRIEFPAIYTDLLAYFDFLNLSFLNLDMMPTSCIYALNWHTTFVAKTSGPLILVLLLGILAVKYSRESERAERPAASRSAHAISEACSSTAFFVIFLAYPTCSTLTFYAFQCEVLHDETSWLQQDLSIPCDMFTHPNGFWHEYIIQPYAYVMILLYPIGTIVLFAVIMWTHRHTLQRLQRSEVRTELHKRTTLLRQNSKDLGTVLMRGMWTVVELPPKVAKNFDSELQHWAARTIQREYLRHILRRLGRNVPPRPTRPSTADASLNPDTVHAWAAKEISAALACHVAIRMRIRQQGDKRRALLRAQRPQYPPVPSREGRVPSVLVMQEGRLAWFFTNGVPSGKEFIWFGAHTGVAKGELWLSASSICKLVEGVRQDGKTRFCAMAVTASPVKDHSKGYRRTCLFEPAASGQTPGDDSNKGASSKETQTLLDLFQKRQLLLHWKCAIDEVSRGRRGATPAGSTRQARADLEVRRDDTKAARQFRRDALAALPGFFRKLTGAYEYRVFWFEIFECIRKICLIGLPIFFPHPGQEEGVQSLEQMVLGLLICFISFGAYMYLSPYVRDSDDFLAVLCQFQIFFSLLVGVILFGNPPEAQSQALGFILSVMLAVPPIVAIIGNNPFTTSVLLHPQRRAKLMALLDKYVFDPVADMFLSVRVGQPRDASLRSARRTKAKIGKKLAVRVASLPAQELQFVGLGDEGAREAAISWAVEHRSEYQLRAALDDPIAFFCRVQQASKPRERTAVALALAAKEPTVGPSCTADEPPAAEAFEDPPADQPVVSKAPTLLDPPAANKDDEGSLPSPRCSATTSQDVSGQTHSGVWNAQFKLLDTTLADAEAVDRTPGETPVGTADADGSDIESSPQVMVEHLVTFDAGRLGLGISSARLSGLAAASCDSDFGVVVSSVDDGSAASAQSVHVGDVVIEVSGLSTRGLGKDEVLSMIVAASRPLTLLLRHQSNMVKSSAGMDAAPTHP